MRLYKLTKTDEFSSVFNFRKRVYGRWLIANIKPNIYGQHRYGLVVSKKIARQAVKRNYMKRVLRALLQQQTSGHEGCDVVLQVKQAFRHQDFDQIAKEVTYLLVKINTFSNSVRRP